MTVVVFRLQTMQHVSNGNGQLEKSTRTSIIATRRIKLYIGFGVQLSRVSDLMSCESFKCTYTSNTDQA